MDVISIFDTSISDYNLGNQIIMDSVNLEIRENFNDCFVYKLPYIEITKHTLNCISQSKFVFFGGTNSLNNKMEVYKQWGLNMFNVRRISNVVLLGLGWLKYEEGNMSMYTKYMLNHVLSKDFIHSVRDSYTEKKLKSEGFKVINTGCPTLWRLNSQIIGNIPKKKSSNVVFTLTDYNKDFYRDTKLINCCLKNYSRVYFWPQGIGDIQYLKELGYIKQIEIINPYLFDFDYLIKNTTIDYVGTRLHAGIRSLQSSIRAFIIGIDNRSKEMASDFGLPVVDLNKLDGLDELINKDYELILKLPVENINNWKSQFKK